MLGLSEMTKKKLFNNSAIQKTTFFMDNAEIQGHLKLSADRREGPAEPGPGAWHRTGLVGGRELRP